MSRRDCFSEAEAVVGLNGSALANMAFAQPGSVLIEPFDTNYYHTGDWELASAAGAAYHTFLSSSPPTYSHWRDIQVSVADVLDALALHDIPQARGYLWEHRPGRTYGRRTGQRDFRGDAGWAGRFAVMG